jgi:hypothetical protein
VRPQDVAVAALRIASLSGVPVRPAVHRDPGFPNGRTVVWARNGYGVSLIEWADDEYPELKVIRDGDGEILDVVTVSVHGKRRSTDRTGIMRNVSPDEAAAVLGVIARWDA